MRENCLLLDNLRKHCEALKETNIHSNWKFIQTEHSAKLEIGIVAFNGTTTTLSHTTLSIRDKFSVSIGQIKFRMANEGVGHERKSIGETLIFENPS